MALQVWLPLNGNLNNQGLATITHSGSPTYIAGKTGQALSLAGQVQFTGLPKLPKFTIAFWARVDTCAADWSKLLSITSKQADGASAANFRFEATISSRACSWHNNSPYSISSGTQILITNKEEWHHVCVSYDGKNIYSYADGVLLSTQAGLGGYLIDNFYIGQASNITGGMNDLRIYDECLSINQIKELSRGLVAHYSCKNLYGNANLEAYTNQGVRGWTKVFGDYYAVTLSEVNWLNTRACKMVVTTNNTSSTATYRVMCHKGDVNYKDILIPDTTYTLSFDSTSNKWSVGSISATNGQNDLTANADPIIEARNGYYHCVYHLTTVASDNAAWSQTNQYVYICYNGAGGSEAIITNLKLELGEHDTIWSDKNDPNQFASFEDESGNNYSMTYSTLKPTVCTNGIRGISSMKFDGISTQYLYRPYFDFLTKSLTMSAWLYQTSATSTTNNAANTTQFAVSQGRDFNDGVADGYGANIRVNNGVPAFCCGTIGTLTSGVNITGGWHLVTCTWDGTTAKIYVDGLLKNSAAVSSISYSKANNAFVIGKMSHGYTGGAYFFPFNGYINDVRVYATALTADDILGLYQNSAYVDNYGNINAYEFMEVE